MIETIVIIQRAVYLCQQVFEEIQGNQYIQARDHAHQTLSLIELLTSLTSQPTHTALTHQLNVCLDVLHHITTCSLLNDSLSLPLIISQAEIKESKDDGKGDEEKIKFSQIIGSDDAKQTLYENIVLPLSLSKSVRQDIFRGVRSSGGNVLLFGPPGTGKTCLAQATASESSSVLFSIRPSEVLSKYQGESERYLSRLFETAKKMERAIIFFDASKTEIGGSVIVIAATNRLEDLDEAILRRFDCKIFVGTPNCENRIRMIEHFLEGITNSLAKHELQDIANGTEGWSGAEIQSLCREAAMIPVREAFPCSANQATNLTMRMVTAADFDIALQAILKPHMALDPEGDS